MARNYYKEKKEQARHDIDDLVNNTTQHNTTQHSPSPNTERPGRSNRYDINTALDSYATALQKESTPREK